MMTRSQLLTRINAVSATGVPITNYGMAIEYCAGIFDRVMEIF